MSRGQHKFFARWRNPAATLCVLFVRSTKKMDACIMIWRGVVIDIEPLRPRPQRGHLPFQGRLNTSVVIPKASPERRCHQFTREI